jgi:hypothetical protein
MVKILNTNIATVGIYYGQTKSGEAEIEDLSYNALSKLCNIYKEIPVTFNHKSGDILGYFDNIKMVSNMMMGDLNLYLENDLEKCINRYISPEFILSKDSQPIAIIYASIVDNPAISDNLKILNDEYVLNGKKKMPYRASKVQYIKIMDNDACDRCKKTADKTRNKPVTWGQANAMLPVHPNCRCKIVNK